MYAHHDHRPLRVVVAGGGVAALELIVALRALAPAQVEVVMIAPADEFSWRALEVGEPFGLVASRRYRLSNLADELGAQHLHDAVHAVERETREVVLQSGPSLEYDVLVLAVGAFRFPAVEDAATLAGGPHPDEFDEVLADLRSALARRLAVVVPRDGLWPLPAYELALLTAHSAAGSEVTVVSAEDAPLAMFGHRASREVARVLAEAGVQVRCGAEGHVAAPGSMRVGNRWLTVDRIVALPGLAGPRMHGVPSDAAGFTVTDERHVVPGCDGRVFAIGDAAAGAIRQGGLAAQAAERVATQIAELAGAERRAPLLRPMLRGVLRTAHGPLFLEAACDDPEATSRASRKALWWPPSKVAAPWLASFLEDLETRRLRPASGGA